MAVMDILKDDAKGGKTGMGRVLTLVTAATLTFGFYKEAIQRQLDWKDYIAYSLAMLFSYATAKAIELIKAIKGNGSVGELLDKKDKD